MLECVEYVTSSTQQRMYRLGGDFKVELRLDQGMISLGYSLDMSRDRLEHVGGNTKRLQRVILVCKSP